MSTRSISEAQKSETHTVRGIHRFMYILFTLLLVGGLDLAPGLPAEAATTFEKTTNWSGVAGKPAAIGGAPVTVAQMFFDIPVVECQTNGSHISIWTGMDTDPAKVKVGRVTQAGVDAACKKGGPVWSGWFEAYPAVVAQPLPGLPQLHSGQHVLIAVTYRPDIASDAFVASFVISESNTPTRVVNKTFYSPSGAAQRDRAECIVERPDVVKSFGPPLVTEKKPIPRFHNANGTDFSASCLVGNGKTMAYLSGHPDTDCVFDDLYVARTQLRNPRALVTARPLASSSVQWHWIASK